MAPAKPLAPPPAQPAAAPAAKATAGPPHGLTTLLVLADGRLPAGGHAHSGGLEAAVTAGRVHDLATLEAFLRGRLATAGLVAAAFAAATTHRLTNVGTIDSVKQLNTVTGLDTVTSLDSATGLRTATGLDTAKALNTVEMLDAVRELDAGLDARTPSPALRRASRAQGRALLRAGRAMWTLPAGQAYSANPDGPHQSVALGVVAAAAGLPPGHAALVAAYGSVSGSASAAVRVLGLDPYPVHGLLARLAAACDETADRAAHVAHLGVSDLPAASAPLLDISAEDHSAWEVRLFAS
jgi:urease accessory protein